jgi:hypothetical protein
LGSWQCLFQPAAQASCRGALLWGEKKGKTENKKKEKSDVDKIGE